MCIRVSVDNNPFLQLYRRIIWNTQKRWKDRLEQKHKSLLLSFSLGIKSHHFPSACRSTLLIMPFTELPSTASSLNLEKKFKIHPLSLKIYTKPGGLCQLFNFSCIYAYQSTCTKKSIVAVTNIARCKFTFKSKGSEENPELRPSFAVWEQDCLWFSIS